MGRGKIWDKNDIFKAVQLEAMGYKHYEIAKMFNRTYSAVGTMFWFYRKGCYDDRLRSGSGSEA